jgi:hypothetical protein
VHVLVKKKLWIKMHGETVKNNVNFFNWWFGLRFWLLVVFVGRLSKIRYSPTNSEAKKKESLFRIIVKYLPNFICIQFRISMFLYTCPIRNKYVYDTVWIITALNRITVSSYFTICWTPATYISNILYPSAAWIQSKWCYDFSKVGKFER